MRQLSEANESMGRCLRDMGSSGDSARLMHVLQRHRELLHEYEKECRKIKANIKEQRERDELLHSVRRDIGEFKTAAASRTDSLVRERASATNSLKTTDQLLKGAAATYESLKNQRQLYNSIAVKLSAFRSRLPSIDQLVGRIQKRKKTESIILAMVIAACAITVIYFAVLR
jgi:Golgi SNAP receptor complex protein 1